MTASSDFTIVECSCGNFELHRDGRLVHVAENRAAAERAVALILASEAEYSQERPT